MASIDPSTLGTEHLDRIVEVYWNVQTGNRSARSVVRGVLTRVAHDRSGTTIDLDLGPLPVTIDLDIQGGDVQLVDG